MYRAVLYNQIVKILSIIFKKITKKFHEIKKIKVHKYRI